MADNFYFAIKLELLVDFELRSEPGSGAEEQQQMREWTREAFYCQSDCFLEVLLPPGIRLGDEEPYD